MIISRDTEKNLKIPTLSLDKIKLGMEENFVSLIKLIL